MAPISKALPTKKNKRYIINGSTIGPISGEAAGIDHSVPKPSRQDRQ
jgi:hypothetical protein